MVFCRVKGVILEGKMIGKDRLFLIDFLLWFLLFGGLLLFLLVGKLLFCLFWDEI